MPPDLTSPVPALVGRYLQQISSCIARPFTLEFQPREADFCLEEVVRSYREESRVVVDRQWDSLVNSLVYGYLLQVSPGLAKEFRELVKCRKTEHELENFVEVLLERIKIVKLFKTVKLDKNIKGKPSQKFVKASDVKESKPKISKYRTFIRRHFTPEENAMILATDGTNKSLTKVARSIGRHHNAVINRYERLCQVLPGKKEFSPLDDQIILDAVLDNTHGKKLTEVSLSSKTWKEIADRLKRSWRPVIGRWTLTLLPWLLRHHAGTLNLRIEVMLANHVLETYGDITSINWSEVARKVEFAGNTAHSLKNRSFRGLYTGTAKKYSLKESEITLGKVLEYTKVVYGGGRKINERVIECQKLAIMYFENKVLRLGLSNLV